ncbi:unnamed protein product [Cuscuta campestris]|uniref:Replication protein A OB domain-containing protein n=1 Tax=Cuscuta campestris TaxID=132261 RepID=A0A484K4P7_9ASTE|nr:unnamed protein product [Cuscuta campestris]
MEITLEDHEGNRLACTLWGEYVEKFLNCVTQGVPGPFILLLSFCKPRRYQGTVTVSTSFHVTKMILDGNSDEVNQFRASLPLQVDDVSSLTTLMMGGGNEEVNEPLKITPSKTLIDTTKDHVRPRGGTLLMWCEVTGFVLELPCRLVRGITSLVAFWLGNIPSASPAIFH